MSELILSVAIGLALLAVLAWLSLSSRSRHLHSGETPRVPLEDLIPRHALYISHIQNALSDRDTHYLKDRVSRKRLRAVLTERRRVAREFLAGLRDDFGRLEKLARLVASFSPKVSYRQELELVWLGVRFRALCRFAELRLSFGPPPIPAFEELAGLIGSLSARLEAAITLLAESALPRVDVGV